MFIGDGISNFIRFITRPLDISSYMMEPPMQVTTFGMIAGKEKLMTRNEAIELFEKIFPPINNTTYAAKWIDFYIEAGMLKVEEEKSVKQKAIEHLSVLWGEPTANKTLEVLDCHDLKIVEK